MAIEKIVEEQQLPERETRIKQEYLTPKCELDPSKRKYFMEGGVNSPQNTYCGDINGIK